nr:60S ribosomal protein L19-3-like [Tanacetum cinerariifolium]
MKFETFVILVETKALEVEVVTTPKIITEVVTATSETVTAVSIIIPAVEPQVPAATLTVAPVRVTAAPSKRRKGVVIRDPESESTTFTIIPAETKSKDKGKGVMDEAIDHVKRKAKGDLTIKRYQVLKRKPQTEGQARKNMIMYLKNVAGFKMDYFKGISYDDIRLIFETKFNSNVDFLLKTKEQLEEKENRALQKINETPAESNQEEKRRLRGFVKSTCSNLEESKKCIWSSKGQELEATGIMWCADYKFYNHIANFVSGEEQAEMVSLKLRKQLATCILKCGRGKVWLDPKEGNEISMANSHQNIKKLVKDGFIIRKPTKIHSRSRARRMAVAKRKGRRHSRYDSEMAMPTLLLLKTVATRIIVLHSVEIVKEKRFVTRREAGEDASDLL